MQAKAYCSSDLYSKNLQQGSTDSIAALPNWKEFYIQGLKCLSVSTEDTRDTITPTTKQPSIDSDQASLFNNLVQYVHW